MQIRKGTLEDMEQILALYAQAREFMVRTGNPRQWAARSWPPEWLIRRDIEQGKCHVCTDGQGIAAVFYFDVGEDIDPTYRCIHEGSWLAGGVYGVVHRIAARAGSGAGKYCIRWAYEQCGYLRIDTHGDNRVMQKVLKDLGFSQRGTIYIAEDNDPRLAYEKI